MRRKSKPGREGIDDLRRHWMPDDDRLDGALERILERVVADRHRPNEHSQDGRPMTVARRTTLSEAELNALRAIAAGLTRQETADVLGYSLEGVKSHLKNVRRLLRAKTNAHAVAEGFRRRLLT